jgi:hypothetical protein
MGTSSKRIFTRNRSRTRIDIARNFLHNLSPGLDLLYENHEKDNTLIGRETDIVAKINDKYFELGSYGIRNWNNLTWVYGTGLAESRTSNVISMLY